MSDDSTFRIEQSADVWLADWSGAASIPRTSPGGPYEEIVIDVYRNPAAPRPEAPEGWKVYANGTEDVWLRHGSTGCALFVLHVHMTGWAAIDPDGHRHRIREELPFRVGNRRYTSHFQAQVGSLMGGFGLTMKKCAEICHTTPAIVKEINKARLFALAGDMMPARPSRHIAIDEFQIAGGRRFCTIVVDADDGALLYLERGRGQLQARHFFEWVGEDFMARVEAVSMDMNAGYAAAFTELYPQVAIVYDGFHIIQLYNDKVIDSLRRSTAKRLKKEADRLAADGDADGAAAIEAERRLLFGERYDLLANERTLRAKDALGAELNAEARRDAAAAGLDPAKAGQRRQDRAESRAALLDANASLQCVVRAREELQALLALDGPVEMLAGLVGWCELYSNAGIAQLTRFTKTVMGRLEGIASRAFHKISSGILEGTNNLAKAVRWQAFGLVDFDYFGLLLWEQTRLPNRRRRVVVPRPYTRSKKRNERR